MVRLFLIFLISLSITLFGLLNAEGAPPIPPMDQLVKAPQIIEHQKKPHAVFDYGGLEYLFVISKTPTPFPTCNAVQSIGNELMVVRSDPFGYVFFVIKNPIAFKTDHSPLWEELVRESRRLRIIRETIKEESKGKWVSANDVLKSDPTYGVASSIPSHFLETCEQLEFLYDGLQLHFGKERLGKKNASKSKK